MVACARLGGRLKTKLSVDLAAAGAANIGDSQRVTGARGHANARIGGGGITCTCVREKLTARGILTNANLRWR